MTTVAIFLDVILSYLTNLKKNKGMVRRHGEAPRGRSTSSWLKLVGKASMYQCALDPSLAWHTANRDY